MEKANQVLRRSSVKLKCLNSGHSDLNMIISDIKEMKSSFKSFHLAQVTTWEDMSKWANKERTVALQEILHVLLDLCFLWSEVQLDFIAGIKKFKHQFNLILESETLLDKSKAHLASCEQRENKVKKELKKATAKANIEEAKQLSERHVETHGLVQAAQSEVKSKALENEAVKLMLVKEGLLNISSCYVALADKASIIFQAHREVSTSLPDVHDKDIEDIRYPGAEAARNIVMKTKETVHRYKKTMEAESAPPPPYSNSPAFHNSSRLPVYNPDIPQNIPGYSPHHIQQYSPNLRQVSEYSQIPGNIESPEFGRPPNYPPLYDLPPAENQDVTEGAVGGSSNAMQLANARYANI